jgi:hypothetical protein
MKKLSKRTALIIVILVAILLVSYLGFTITRILVPERSAVSFCTYSKVHDRDFNSPDYAKLADLYAGLERVSPDEIRPDVAKMQKRYAEISSDPTNTGTVGLSLLEPAGAISEYTSKNCAK